MTSLAFPQDYLLSSELERGVRWRHHLHAHPELAFREEATSTFVAEQLTSFGYKVIAGLGGTGVIGTLSKGSSRKVIGIRADMDALPIHEATGLGHGSRHDGVMHACGHDGHVAMALVAAGAIARQGTIDGTVHFIFQPAEENEGGARAMVADGLFDRFPCDMIFGAHNWPALDVGTCVARDGAMMAAFATFEIEIVGQGSHGAMPHEGVDPLAASASLFQSLQTIVSRNLSPLDAGVVSVTQLHCGDAWNVIADRAVLRGTARWFDHDVGRRIEQRLHSIASSIAAAHECKAVVRYEHRYPATINDPAAALIVRNVAASRVMRLDVLDAQPSMASEDFAFMLQERPGAYFWLGGKRVGDNPGLHSPYYDFNDAVLPLGARLWCALADQLLSSAG